MHIDSNSKNNNNTWLKSQRLNIMIEFTLKQKATVTTITRRYALKNHDSRTYVKETSFE